MLLLILLLLVTISLALYAGDYLLLRYRIVEKRNPFGVVTVRSYYSIAEKNRKTEFIFNGEQPVTCVHSLFPHLNYAPCWYLRGHPEQQIEM